MSELLPVNDCYNAILEEIKQFSEQEAVSKNISLDGLNAKERSQVYKLFETTYDQLLQFDRQYSLNNGEKQVVLTVKKITPNEKMKITSVTIDDAIVREFRKYTKLPIPIINHQFIDYYIDCLNPYNGGRTMFSQFIKDVESHETVSRLRSRIEQVLDNIVSHIRDDPSMQTFRDNMFEEEIKFRKSSPYKTSGELYKKENQDKLFISVDINKASYNILKYYHPEVFNHLSTWEEFVLSFCGDKPIHILTSSKAIRVRTLGSVNFEKRISFLAEYFIRKVLHEMNITPSSVLNIAKDEVILSYDQTTFHRLFNGYHGPFFRVEAFRLVKLPIYDYFVKEYFQPVQGIDHQEIEIIRREFRCIPLIFLMQCIKQYEGKPILEIDRKITVETGQVATLDESIF